MIVAIVIASRWLKANSVEISSRKVRTASSLPWDWNCRLKALVSLICLSRLLSSFDSMVGLSSASRGSMGSGSEFSLSCQGTGSWEEGLALGLSVAQSSLSPAGAAAGGRWPGPQHSGIIIYFGPEHAPRSVLWHGLLLSACQQGLVGPNTCRKDIFCSFLPSLLLRLPRIWFC